MEISLVDYINWFSRYHVVQDLDSIREGVIVAPVSNEEYLVRLGSVRSEE